MMVAANTGAGRPNREANASHCEQEMCNLKSMQRINIINYGLTGYRAAVPEC